MKKLFMGMMMLACTLMFVPSVSAVENPEHYSKFGASESEMFFC